MVSRGVVSVGRHSGGAEFVAFRLAEHLANQGEEIVFVSDVDPSMLDNVPAKMLIAEIGTYRGAGRLVKHVPMDFPRWVLQHFLGNLRAARKARIVLKSDRPGFDVVHVHGALAAILLRRALRTYGENIPLFYTEHDSTPWSCRYRGKLQRSVRRWIYRHVNLRACRAATTVVANFPSLADEIATRAGLPRSHFVTVRNATDGRWLSDQYAIESIRRRYGFERYCLFVGSLVDRKRPDILLRALTKIELPCIFVGDGPLRDSLERLAVQCGISDRVVFTGAIERRDVHPYYLGAEVLVLPSVSEGVPLVAIEALGAGVPVIASNLTGIATVVHHRENGLLVEPGDEAALAGALTVITADKALSARLKHGARQSSQIVTSWSDVANDLCALYAQHRPVKNLLPVPDDTAGFGTVDILITQDSTRRSPAIPVASRPQDEQI